MFPYSRQRPGNAPKTKPVPHGNAMWDHGCTTDIHGVSPMLIRRIPVYAGDSKVVVGGTPLFAGIVPLVIRHLLGDYWKYKTYWLFMHKCLIKRSNLISSWRVLILAVLRSRSNPYWFFRILLCLSSCKFCLIAVCW